MSTPRTEPWSLTARWVFPVDGPPLDCGIVVLAGDRILAIEANGSQTADLDLGNAAILPGLVNAHTHLDLSGARGQIPPSPDFTNWLRGVIAHRQSRSREQIEDDIRTGLAECLGYGTTLLGDIAVEGESWKSITQAPVRAVVYYEMIGLGMDRVPRVTADGMNWMQDHRPTLRCRPGLSPHAPYSFHGEFFLAMASVGKMLAIHLAETEAERELLERRSGPFVEFLRERGVWEPECLAPNFDWILEQTHTAKDVSFIHANYLDPNTPLPSCATMVYCPRTHAAFGHPPHPFREFLARNVRVALGTDSLASNPDLDLLAEARFIHQRYPDLPGDVILRMATLSGAEALGWADETGSLTPGKSADLVVVPLPDDEPADPHHLVLGSSRPVDRVLFRGRWTKPASAEQP
jgi:cytosine/adenosine deaminase-related metal-dependent hydrolase